MSIAEKSSMLSTSPKAFSEQGNVSLSQLPTDEASQKHTNSLGVLSDNSSTSQDEGLESSYTSLSPDSLQLNYVGTETKDLILLEDTLLRNNNNPFIIDPTSFNLGPDSTLQQDSLPTIPDESLYQDLDGVDGGNGYFHGMDKPGKGQGKQIDNEDLHKAFLLNKELYNRTSEFQSLDGLEGPKFDLGEEAGQDPSNPIYDTIHEQSLLRMYRDPSNDLDLDGNTPNSFQGHINNVEHKTLGQLNKVPGGMTPSAYADINGTTIVNPRAPDGAPTPDDLLFHRTDNPTKYKGLQIDKVDLHEHLLSNPYTYNHGLSQTTIKPSTSDGDRFNYQDLDIDIRSKTPTQYINQELK